MKELEGLNEKYILLNSEPLEDILNNDNKKKVIYFLVHNNNIVYIGKTTFSLKSRIQSHINTDKEFSDIFILNCSSLDDQQILDLEEFYIIKFKPKYNKSNYLNLIDEDFKRDNDIVYIKPLTLIRLFDINPDCVLLYMFYMKTCMIQHTPVVKATNTFCMNGLNLSAKRFYNAKKLLIDNRFIEAIVRKDVHGKTTGHYIKIKYIYTSSSGLENNSEVRTTLSQNHSVATEHTNALDKKINTIDKNINAVNENINPWGEHQHILDHWNSCNIMVHKNPPQKALKYLPKVLKYISADKLKRAITLYSIILKSDKYYFSQKWDLTAFLSRGISNKGLDERRGFWMFIPESNPLDTFKSSFPKDEFTDTIVKFKPITVKYQQYKTLDKDNKLYRGFDLELIKNPWMIKNDLDKVIRGSRDFEFRDFCYLELVIAALIYNRKMINNLSQLQAYIDIWEKKKDEFKERSKQRVKELY